MSTEPGIVSIPAALQQAWVRLGSAKADLARRQELQSLQLQGILKNAGTSITDIETALTEYRKVWNEMVDDGQNFRKIINEKVLAPSLAIEKQYHPKQNDDYITLDKKLVGMKMEQDQRNNAAANKEREKQAYTAHVKNQYAIIEADYKERCLREMNTMYVNYLKTGVKQPDIEAVKQTIQSFILDTAKGTKFQSQYLSLEEKQAVMKSIAAPNLNELRKEMLALVDQKFSSYQHDLRAGTVKQVEQQSAAEVQQMQMELQQDVAVNTLAAQAVETPTLVTEGKALRKTVEVIPENSPAWAMTVCMEFWKNPLIRDHWTGKQWENLSVKQMASCLGKWSSETGEVSDKLQYREVVK